MIFIFYLNTHYLSYSRSIPFNFQSLPTFLSFVFYFLSLIQGHCTLEFLFPSRDCKTITRSFKNSRHDRWYSDMYIHRKKIAQFRANEIPTSRKEVPSMADNEDRATQSWQGRKEGRKKFALRFIDCPNERGSHDSIYQSITCLRTQYNYFKSMV